MAGKNKTVKGFIWRFLERCGAQGVTFVVTIILARLLDPEAYGVVAIVTAITTILSVFIDSGLGTAIIQKKEVDDLDLSTVFYFNIFVCSITYILMFFASPLIANFYEMPELTALTRVISITLLISGVKNIQCSIVSRNLQYKKFFFATLGGTIGAAVIGITMAYLGFGVWAIVAQSLFNNTVDTIILWFTVKWRPKFMFSAKRLKVLLSFSWKLLAASLIDTTYNKLRQLLIGKIYQPEDLAFYDKGEHFPSLFSTNIILSINGVLLPSLSKEQDNVEKVKAMTKRAIKLGTFILMPMMMGLACCAKPFICLFLTEKWLPAVPYLQIFCFSYAFIMVDSSNLNAMQAMGRSDYFLILEIIKKVVGLTILIVSMQFGVMWVALSTILSSILGQLINSYPNKKLIGYSYLEQLKDMLPNIIITLIMGAIVYPINLLNIPDILKLLIQIPLGVGSYIALSIITKNDNFDYALDMIKKLFAKKAK